MTDPQTPATEAGRRTRTRIERALGVHGGLEHESTEAERALLDEARTTALWIVDEQVPLIEAEARASLDVDVLARALDRIERTLPQYVDMDGLHWWPCASVRAILAEQKP